MEFYQIPVEPERPNATLLERQAGLFCADLESREERVREM
jgi:hypothetical protein